MQEDLMKKWMRQPGKIKKLQAFLSISLLFNIFLFLQILPSHGNKEEADAMIVEPSLVVQEPNEEAPQSKVTESELKDFIERYMNNFFAISIESLDFIKTFSSESLFTGSLEKEINSRMEQGIESEFRIDDLFLESISNNQAKALIIGREFFKNSDYEVRNFTIELIINTETIQVESIPLFKVS